MRFILNARPENLILNRLQCECVCAHVVKRLGSDWVLFLSSLPFLSLKADKSQKFFSIFSHFHKNGQSINWYRTVGTGGAELCLKNHNVFLSKKPRCAIFWWEKYILAPLSYVNKTNNDANFIQLF